MLVLTRKLDEQILIGEDIKVTLLRVRGNTVRLGIEAPRDVRIVRAELEPAQEAGHEDFPGCGKQPSGREQVFAHQAEDPTLGGQSSRIKGATRPQLFVGRVKRNGEDARLMRAPLAEFVAS